MNENHIGTPEDLVDGELDEAALTRTPEEAAMAESYEPAQPKMIRFGGYPLDKIDDPDTFEAVDDPDFIHPDNEYADQELPDLDLEEELS